MVLLPACTKTLAAAGYPPYVRHGQGALKRVWNRKLREKSTARGSRTFAVVVLASIAPVLGTIVIVVSSTTPNFPTKHFQSRQRMAC